MFTKAGWKFTFHYAGALVAMLFLGLTAHANSDWSKDNKGDWAKDWRKLGSATVNFSSERDEIRCASKGFVQHIVFEVRNRTVHFEDVEVHLLDGTEVDVSVRSLVRAGERSRIIDLPGNARVIKKIVFRYRSVGSSGKGRAEVVVWGKKK